MGLLDEYNAQGKFADFERAFHKAERSGITREPRTGGGWLASLFASRESARRTALPRAGIEAGG